MFPAARTFDFDYLAIENKMVPE